MSYRKYKTKFSGVVASVLALFFLSSAAIADVNALYRAAQKGDLETARALIANGVDVNARSSLGGSFALNAAAAENDTALLRLLIGSGANANNQAWSGDTALICATKYAGGKTQTVKLLLDAGSDVMLKDEDGKTALDYARAKRQAEAVALLEKAM